MKSRSSEQNETIELALRATTRGERRLIWCTTLLRCEASKDNPPIAPHSFRAQALIENTLAHPHTHSYRGLVLGSCFRCARSGAGHGRGYEGLRCHGRSVRNSVTGCSVLLQI